MIIGAFYWAFLVFGGIVVLLMGAGLVVQLQQQAVDLGSVGGTIAFGLFGALLAAYSGRALLREDAGFVGVRSGPTFGTDHMASSGCLFVLLVVGAGLLLSGPMILLQVPGMQESDQTTFALGAAASIALGAIIVTPAGLILWRRRKRG